MERQELIELCKDAVVHHTKWNNRDSYSAQREIQSIHKGLTAGLEFKIITKEDDSSYHSDEKTLIIKFYPQTIDEDKLEATIELKISSRDDYFKDCDPDYETEMFDGDGIDFDSDYTQGYMPTRKRLEMVGIGNDWY